jgi:hypothetical protein
MSVSKAAIEFATVIIKLKSIVHLHRENSSRAAALREGEGFARPGDGD